MAALCLGAGQDSEISGVTTWCVYKLKPILVQKWVSGFSVRIAVTLERNCPPICNSGGYVWVHLIVEMGSLYF